MIVHMGTVVGVYSSAVDANQCVHVRGLQRVGCVGATMIRICEARLNSKTPTGRCPLASASTSDVYPGSLKHVLHFNFDLHSES